MSGAADHAADHAQARARLMGVMAALLEALYPPSAIEVLRTLKPADMRPGGARVPGTSYELPVTTAARVMQKLAAQRDVTADRLLAQLAVADELARLAALTGKAPPTVASLYPHCVAGVTGVADVSLNDALQRLFRACEALFSLTHLRRLDQQCTAWSADPATLDAMPVQQFVARFVRNAPP